MIAVSARTADRAVGSARQFASRCLDYVQLRLRVMEVRSDPHVHAWADEMRRLVEDGSLAVAVKEQPTVDEIVDSWHSSKTS